MSGPTPRRVAWSQPRQLIPSAPSALACGTSLELRWRHVFPERIRISRCRIGSRYISAMDTMLSIPAQNAKSNLPAEASVHRVCQHLGRGRGLQPALQALLEGVVD